MKQTAGETKPAQPCRITESGYARILPRTFRLIRQLDVSGISGIGHVADGAVFSDGTAVLRWRGLHATTTVFDCVDDLIRIHGHGGTTSVVFDVTPWVISTSQDGREGTE